MEPGLDFAFLKYIDVTPETQRPIRQFYVPLFAGCQQVVDLGCGTGDFVELLREANIEAWGVDSDPLVYEDLQRRGIPIVLQDVIAYLEDVEPESLDGIYNAHLVEHLPYEVVLKLIRLSFRALRPGGRLIIATPNPRALISHLEFYHMHFGHEAFYHPRLLSFFLEHCGFQEIEDGENPITTPLTASSVFGTDAAPGQIRYRRSFPAVHNPLRKLSRFGKSVLFRFIVQPFLDDLERQINGVFRAHYTALQQTGVMDRAFECYVIGNKPAVGQESIKPDGQR
jgi:O-antigen chain-terminating methyltransferase